MSNNKKIIWLVIVLVVLAIVFMGMRKGATVNPGATPTPSLSASPKVSSTPVSKNPVVTPTPLLGSYSQLVLEYGDRRVQFNNSCYMLPATPTFKNGSKIMFDNRSSDTRTITIDGTAYTFAGYGYRVVTLSSATLPRTISINCGSLVNAGQITLQK